MHTTARPRTPSTGLRGVTNLAVLAPVRQGLVASFEPISYVQRLKKVLLALQSARENLRESELLPSAFVDTIGRLDIIHHFRYALVRPQGGDGTYRLSLNVTFDGGWEPYMRVIYRDIGPMLDLLFCHNATYPGSRGPFTQYCDWVRENEMEAGFFYSESAVTLQDQRYLAELEKLQRERNASDADFARLALPSGPAAQKEALARAMKDPVRALVLPLRTLKGLYRLSVYFPGDPRSADPRDEAAILRRFTQSVLAESIRVMQGLDQLPPQAPGRDLWEATKAQLRDELAWLGYRDVPAAAKPEPDVCDPARLQSHLLASKAETATHGCVALLRIRKDQATQALATLSGLVGNCKCVAMGGAVAYVVGFTYAGLRELGIAQDRLDAFPQEFYEGMEARHAILGDLRGNHPDRWQRPLVWDQDSGQRVDLNAVHVMVHMRLANPANTGHALDPALRPLVQALDRPEGGLRVLAVEPLRSYRDAGGTAVGHLKVADGLSQPVIPDGPQPADWPQNRDQVNSGELLLGRRNDRGDRFVEVDALLQDGSFLVVRKLRQRMDHFDAAMAKVPEAQREEVLAKMVGRQRDGTPLSNPGCPAGSNAFDFDAPAASDGCPFHSHIRRSNPRDGRAYTPRILRRGMSYGPPQAEAPEADRGVMFMAYCGSIAEQFETIQRWVAGGNSSGVGSAQGDPLLRVPQHGESHTFRYLDAKGEVVRVTFDDKPLVELNWGLYLFVPSLPVLENLAKYRAPARNGASTKQEPPGKDALEQMRDILEDRERAPAYWARVREKHGGREHTAYGELVGSAKKVMEILHDGGTKYSVQGYGRRMTASLGDNILGMDDAQRQDQLGVREVLEGCKEEDAFAATLKLVDAVLAKFQPIPGVPGDIVRRPVDLVTFSDYVLALLCNAWFGLPQLPEKVAEPVMVPGGRLAQDSKPARCPGHFLNASRYIFTPHPNEDVERAGQEQGRTALRAVEAWLATNPDLQQAPLTLAIQRKLKDPKLLAPNIAGILLGFPPTVQPNFLRVMDKWISRESALWKRQQDLFDVSPQKGVLTYEQACKALRDAVFDTLREEPVPGMLWRCPVEGKGGVDFTPERQVILGITSALADGAPRELVFGRDADTAGKPTVHGCPGYHMAMGVLLGMIGGLMKAGTLRPTGSPVLLILTPNT